MSSAFARARPDGNTQHFAMECLAIHSFSTCRDSGIDKLCLTPQCSQILRNSKSIRKRLQQHLKLLLLLTIAFLHSPFWGVSCQTEFLLHAFVFVFQVATTTFLKVETNVAPGCSVFGRLFAVTKPELSYQVTGIRRDHSGHVSVGNDGRFALARAQSKLMKSCESFQMNTHFVCLRKGIKKPLL
jgi:hypothetical protein